MKRILLFVCTVHCCFFGVSQIGFELNYVPAEVSYLEDITVADVSGNGYLDIVYSTTYAGTGSSIRISRNVSGPGNFTVPTYVSNLNYANILFTADLDGDNDIDIISANSIDDTVAWHRNYSDYFDLDTQDLISNTLDGPSSVFADDLDGDGDIDILVAARSDDKVVWFENLDGFGNFGSEQLVTDLIDNPSYVESADIDGDGDSDIMIASLTDDSIIWFRNIDGQGNFEIGQTITVFVDYVQKAGFADIDNDGDLDVLSASTNDHKIAWYENLDGLGDFGQQQVIATDLLLVKDVVSGDMDNDGDLDIIASSGSYGGTDPQKEIAWFENIDGQGTFGSKQTITGPSSGAHSIITRDMNADGWLDVVFVASNQLGWYKNLGVVRNEINGNVRLDSNYTGCDSNDVPIPNLIITTTNGTESLSTLSLNNSFYQLFPDTGDYTTTISSELPSFFNVYPNTHSTSFEGYGQTDVADFCLQAVGSVDDLSVSFYPLFSDARPGFYSTYQLVYRNTGTSSQSGTVSLEFDDSKLQFISANENITQINSATLEHGYANLSPFEIRKINLRFYVYPPPTTEIDDELEFITTINPVQGDATEDDNVYGLKQTVVGSYDPNDIRVLEGDQILYENIDKYLHYIIRFQNTGTASAINVSVAHILDPKLDWTTMQLESLSHEGRVEIIDGSAISFIFDDINLPDSTNDEPNSHGYIAFKIKPKADVLVGDIINAVADIYFDYNPPITTNTAQTEIVDNLSVSDVEAQRYWIYPNPTTDILHIKSQQNFDHIRILDINGRTIETISLEGLQSTYQLHLESLGTGIYFLEIGSSNATITLKFIKQ
jgi:hypothetical protein